MQDAIATNTRRTQLAKVYTLLLQQRYKRELLNSRQNEPIALRQTAANPNVRIEVKEVKAGVPVKQLLKDRRE